MQNLQVPFTNSQKRCSKSSCDFDRSGEWRRHENRGGEMLPLSAALFCFLFFFFPPYFAGEKMMSMTEPCHGRSAWRFAFYCNAKFDQHREFQIPHNYSYVFLSKQTKRISVTV